MRLSLTPRLQIGIAVIVVLGFGNLGWLQAKPPKQHLEANQQSAENGNPQQERKSFAERTISDPINLFTLGLLICAAGTLVVIVRQLGWMKQTDVRLGQQITLARKSVDALPAVERAYVRFDYRESLSGMQNVRPGTPVKVWFRNYGKTPAECGASYCLFRYSPIEPPPHPGLNEQFAHFHTLAAGESFLLATPELAMTDEEHGIAMRAGGYLYLMAKVVYVDIFDQRHETAICYTWDPGMDRFFQYERASTDERLNYHT